MSRIGRDFNRSTPRSNITSAKINTTPSTLSVSLPQERLLPSSDAPQKVASPGPSNIERKTRYTKSNKVLIKTDPGSLVMAGMGNTISDYGGIVDGNYKDKSILNQSMGKALEGDWEGAGTLIREHPYRFAGNLLVEAGLNIIPVGGVLKAAKITKLATTVLQHNKIAPVVSAVTKTVEPITNAADKVIKKVIPAKTTTTIYSIKPDDALPAPWNNAKPNEYYFEKVINKYNAGPGGSGSGIPQIRSVDVPNTLINFFKADEMIKVLPKTPVNKNVIKVEKKAFGMKLDPTTGDWVPINKPNVNTPPIGELKSVYNPNKIGPLRPGEQPLSNYYRQVTKEQVPINENRKNYNDMLKITAAQEIKDKSRSLENEYFIDLALQNTEKVVATAGKKVSWVNKLLNPQYSNDQMTNALVKINKQQGNPTSLNAPGGQLISPSREISKIPQPFSMADDILKSGVPNPGFMSPLMWGASTAKTVASGASSNNKRVDKNAGLFGGYGQFLQ
jgi:hypothetical protein